MSDLRREVKELVDKSGIDIPQISTKLGVSISAIYSWMNGERGISKKNLKKLRALAEGKLEPEKSGGIQYPITPDQIGIIKDAPGRFTQLTEQVYMLQSCCGKLEERNAKLEERIKALEEKIKGWEKKDDDQAHSA